MIKETMEFLSQYDPEVGATIEKEYHREQRNIELIASENIVSPFMPMKVSPGWSMALNAARLAEAPEWGWTFACSAPKSLQAR